MSLCDLHILEFFQKGVSAISAQTIVSKMNPHLKQQKMDGCFFLEKTELTPSSNIILSRLGLFFFFKDLCQTWVGSDFLLAWWYSESEVLFEVVLGVTSLRNNSPVVCEKNKNMLHMFAAKITKPT